MKERPYESTDLPGVMEIYTASIRSLAASYYSPEQIAAWAPVPPDAARWQERLSHLHTIVAESDGGLAGFASYTHDGYLDFLFTHPTCARRGVATRLYQRVESALRTVNAPRVTTHASLAARPFFDRTASNSMQRSGSSAEALTSAGSPCTNNSAMNKTPSPLCRMSSVAGESVGSWFRSLAQ
jgi:putative acetyltransferase